VITVVESVRAPVISVVKAVDNAAKSMTFSPFPYGDITRWMILKSHDVKKENRNTNRPSPTAPMMTVVEYVIRSTSTRPQK
jgi:hypothetical protein